MDGKAWRYGCLFCQTNAEAIIAGYINQTITDVEAAAPTRTRRKTVAGKAIEDQVQLLPGYIFFRVESDESIPRLPLIANVLKSLEYDNLSWELTGGDREFAEFLLDNGLLQLSQVTFIDDSLSASLTQLESVISSHMDAVAEPKKPAGTALIVVGILLVIAGAALGVLMMPVLVAVAAVGLLLCIIGVTGKSSYKKKVQAFEAYKQADAQRQEANQKKAELQAQLTREQTEIASLEQELGEHNAVIDSDGSVISTWIARWGQADGEVSETIITQIMDRAAVVRRLREKQAAADSVQDFVNEQTASINAERAAINTLYVEHQPVVDYAEGQRISGLADGQPILAETHIGVNQVQLLPRQVVVCRSVLDDFVALGHRPCEVVYGLLGAGGQGFCKR